MKNINKENRLKLALKREGHSLIDRIKWKGYSKQSVYYMLADKLGVEEKHAHFMQMNTLRELERAVSALRWIEARVPRQKRQANVPMPSAVKVYRADQTVTVLKPPKPPKEKKRDMHTISLPQSAYMEELRKVAEANRIALMHTPTENWLYRMYKKLW